MRREARRIPRTVLNSSLMRYRGLASSVKYLPLVFLLLAACEAPPTAMQVTSRAVKRNCEAQGIAAANEIRRQNAQIVKEGSSVDEAEQYRMRDRADRAQEQAFKDCMYRYSV